MSRGYDEEKPIYFYAEYQGGHKMYPKKTDCEVRMFNEGIEIEFGINKRPKDITEDMMRNSVKIVNMGCMEKDWCPTAFVPNLVDWGIENPKGKSIEKVREIRDEIQERVRGLIASLPKEN